MAFPLFRILNRVWLVGRQRLATSRSDPSQFVDWSRQLGTFGIHVLTQRVLPLSWVGLQETESVMDIEMDSYGFIGVILKR